MNNSINRFNSMDQVQHWLLTEIINSGSVVCPRGLATRELSPVYFTLLNPRKRCISNPVRKWSLNLALGEFCWHLSGSNDINHICHYTKLWKEFTEDGFTIQGSCYGHKVFTNLNGQPSQWEKLIHLLQDDPESRRAVLYFVDTNAEIGSAKDIACACSIQFLIRDGQVNAIVYMRSNDAILGLPYDVFLFTMLQELLAVELNLSIGTYNHFIGSAHLYDKHIELAKNIVNNFNDSEFEMPQMDHHKKLVDFLLLEQQLRNKNLPSKDKLYSLPTYWRDLLNVLIWNYKKRNDLAIDMPTNFSPYYLFLKFKENSNFLSV